MPKMKTHSGTKKRVRVTGTGRLMHKCAGRSAKMVKKSSRVTRRLAQRREVSRADAKLIRRLLAI
jgi:large subunit ribosomal protein L35